MEGSKRSLSRRLRREQDHADNHTTTIPFDLIIEILSLLPAKSLIYTIPIGVEAMVLYYPH